MINYLLHIVHNLYMINCLLSITYRGGKKEDMQEERKGGGRKKLDEKSSQGFHYMNK